ncbi:glycosyltransferase family 2 protein [Flavobacterium chilense]|uniref:Glycosyltransferase involved in cell wall bisynthesis n=1 Tax=Flavobacterium chilense TaxID=946677 RepID=A0A1M7GQ26_9FLAO|nr:glycosyltransferase family 2 protein [Flavobacterium chilense]SHM18413.1 Glycosyltransferase involved in cell wall bisynthesis [Flavobacterium chilense]
MNKPLVSIIIPTYNRANLIGETLDCLIRQTYSNWECIIIDDNSSDKTEEIIKFYQENDNRFKLILKSKDDKKGASVSRNIGLKIAKGDYIQFLDSDDILAVNKLEVQIQLLSNEAKFVISTCKWGRFDQINEPFNLNENNPDYRNFDTAKEYFDLIGLHGGFFPSHSFLINKELIIPSGYWNESLTMNDDGEFFFRILLNCSKIIFASNTYVLYRNNISGENLSLLKTQEKANSLVNSWKIIESLYYTKYSDSDSAFLDKKKQSIYFGIKREFPKVITENKMFFKRQIKNDTVFLKLVKLKKKVIHKLKIIFKQ